MLPINNYQFTNLLICLLTSKACESHVHVYYIKVHNYYINLRNGSFKFKAHERKLNILLKNQTLENMEKCQFSFLKIYISPTFLINKIKTRTFLYIFFNNI